MESTSETKTKYQIMLKPACDWRNPDGGWKYTQPETGVPIKAASLMTLINRVSEHRRAINETGVMGLDMADGWVERLTNDVCVQNPNIDCSDHNERFYPMWALLAQTGRERWAELHGFATSCKLDNVNDMMTARAWMDAFTLRVPDYGCKCRAGWRSILGAHPPDLSSTSAFSMWTRHVHDAVNKKLGRPFFEPSSYDSPVANFEIPG